MSARAAYLASCATLTALVALAIAWELWLAPARPGGSWLVLKVMPLLFCVPGVFRGSRHVLKLSTLLVWLAVAEGAARVWTDPAPAAQLALAQVFLGLAYFGSVVACLRASPESTGRA